jgi:hypothetical protein
MAALAALSSQCGSERVADIAALIIAFPLWFIGMLGIAFFVDGRLRSVAAAGRLAIMVTTMAAWTMVIGGAYLAGFGGHCHLVHAGL